MKTERLQHLEEKNPLLCFLLNTHKAEGNIQLETKHFRLDDACDVIFINGVYQIDLTEAFEKNKKVVFIEDDLSKIASFLEKLDLIEHPSVEVISSHEEELKRVAWKYLYAKSQFVGEHKELKKWLEGVHLLASDTHMHKVINQNIQANILRSHEFVDGRQMHNAYKGATAIVCGSGPSLDEDAIAKLRELEGQVVVIAAGSSMPKLEKSGIRIDYGVFVDPSPPFESYRKMTSFTFPLFYQNRMCQNLFAMHRGEKIWMGTSGGWPLDEKLMKVASIEPWSLDSGWTAGTFAAQIATYLGFERIVFLGMDNGSKNERDLGPNEMVLEGHITRRDLVHARDWLEEFVQKFPETSFYMPSTGLTINGVTRTDEWEEAATKRVLLSKTLEKSELNFPKIAQFIGELNTPAIIESLQSFLEALREGVDSEGFAREKILLEVELSESMLVSYILKPLWDVMCHVFKREEAKILSDDANRDVNDLVMLATFYLQAAKEAICKDTFLLDGLNQGICFCGMLEGEVRRSYPSGSLSAIEYYREGKRHGQWRLFFEGGDVKAQVNYSRGVLHGLFKLWGDRGIKREGHYWYGKKDGRHLVYHSEGLVLLEAKYNKGEPISEHNTYNASGQLIEKLIYQTPKKFDRYAYTHKGDLKYRGVFTGDVFDEEHLDEYGQVISTRKGKWVEEALVWD